MNKSKRKASHNASNVDISVKSKDKKPNKISTFIKKAPSEEQIKKKRKKRKSIVFKPPKLRKLWTSQLLLPLNTNNEPNIVCDNKLRPSTSELEVCEQLLHNKGTLKAKDSILSKRTEIRGSPSINGTHLVVNDISTPSSNSDMSDFSNLNSYIGGSPRVKQHTTHNTMSIYPTKKSSSSEYSVLGDFSFDDIQGFQTTTVLDEFFENTSSEDSYTCDIKDIVCDNIKAELNNTSYEPILDGECTNSSSNYLMEEECHEESDFERMEPNCESFKIDSKHVAVLKYSKMIKIFGYCMVKVLYGKVNILGYTLTKETPEQCIYSPRGTALLTVKNTSKFCDVMKKIKSLVPELSKQLLIKDLHIRKDSSIMIFSKINDFKLKFIEKHISQKILPEETVFPRLDIEPKGSWNCVKIPQEWNDVVKGITSETKFFICGGKGVGKSTFLRYAINCLLQKYEEIRVIDLDPGQSEFTVPGTLTIVSITEPLLGVNYTHLKDVDRSILCDISVSQDPHKYVQCIQELMKFETIGYMKKCPTLINYMGYTNDIAFHLVSSAITITQPNLIASLHSDNRKKNFKIKLCKEMIIEYSKLFSPNLNVNFEAEIIKLPSVTEENTGWTLSPRQLREMCILSYFGILMNETINSLQDFKLPMYEFDLPDVLITDLHNTRVPVEAINANIVALCTLVNEEVSLFQCFGWGIVRAVDFVSRTATIITPIDEDVLEQVTNIVVGGLTLPPSVYMNTEHVLGHIPYVVEGELIDFAQMTKRTHIPSTKKGQA